MRSSLLCCLFPLLMLFGALAGPARPAAPSLLQDHPKLLIAAAADLQFAMDSILKIFKKQAPDQTVSVIYGSSGNFFEQIVNGAPFDLFFSADMDYPRKLQEQGKTRSPIQPYGTGQLVLWSRKLDPARSGMNTLLDPSVSRIAIANPAHAPYGKRAVESLRYYQLYEKLSSRLVFGENISQTAQFARSGAADIGMIALSLARSPAMQAENGHYWLIPASSHQPLQQGFVVLQHAAGNPAAEAFAAFMGSPAVHDILDYFGFGE